MNDSKRTDATVLNCLADTVPKDEVRKALANDQYWMRWTHRHHQLHIPTRYQNARLEDFDQEYQKLIGQSLIITGKPGTGKTHLLAALAFRQVALGLTKGIPPRSFYAKFISVPNLIATIKSSFGKTEEDETEDDIFRFFATANWLYLDDFGTEQATDWSFQTIYRIIDHRYNELLPTVISTNLRLDDIAKNYSERVASRIAGMGFEVVMNGTDKRSQR